jgi:hypothetical protein
VPVSSFSGNWNVVPAPAVGNITRGYAVCNPGNAGWVLATTANRAGGTVSLGGIALENATTLTPFLCCTSGYVPPDVVGTLSGTAGVDIYVNVGSGGGLTRSAAMTADTIGTYQSDGGVNVDLSLQLGAGGGGSGNATEIQGVPVSSAVATRSWGLYGDGTNIRSRLDVPDFRDWSPESDGVTDVSAKLQSFLDTVTQMAGPRYGRITPPGNQNGYLITQQIKVYDDTAGGNAREWTIDGMPAPMTYGVYPHFRFGVPCPSGSAADIVSRYSGVGNATQVIDLGASSGVTVANKETYIGCQIQLWNTALQVHRGEFFIVGVPADNQVTIQNTRTGAQGSDANDGSIQWMIYVPALDFRTAGFTWRGITHYNTTGLFGPMINVSPAFRAGAASVNGFRIDHNVFGSEATKSSRYHIQIGKDYVPRVGHPFVATNGNGDLQVVAATQCDEFYIEHNKFVGVAEIAICHVSISGQSKNGHINHNTFAQGGRGGQLANIGYGTPRTVLATANSWAPEGIPHATFHANVPAAIDTVFLLSGPCSGGIKTISGMYTESPARVVRHASNHIDPLCIRDTMMIWGPTIHPSKEIIACIGEGPLRLDNVFVQQTAGLGGHIMHYPSASGKTALCSMTGVLLSGAPGWVGRCGRIVAGNCGPYKFTDGDTLTIIVNNSGNTRTLKITSNNLQRANVQASVIDFNRIESWMVGRLFNGGAPGTGRARNVAYDIGAVINTETGKAANVTYVVTTGGTTANVGDPSAGWSVVVGDTVTDGTVQMVVSEGFVAWGEFDQSPPSIQALTPGTAGAVQVTGGAMNTELAFAAGIQFGAAQTQVCIDTNGFIDHHSGGGAGNEPVSYELFVGGALCTSYPNYASTHSPMPIGLTRYGTNHTVYNEYRSTGAGSFTANNGTALTLEGGLKTIAAAVGVAAAVVTILDPRCTARSQITPVPTNAAAVADGTPFVSARAAGTFSLTFAAAPTATATWRYTIQEPT